MKKNIICKMLASLLIILIALYFIPFLGICLILFRYFIYSNKKKTSTPIFIIGVGILILIPKGLDLILDMEKVNMTKIPYLNDILSSDLYNVNFINYSKLLISVGVIFFIISIVLNTIFNKLKTKLNDSIRNYILETQKMDAAISKENDMKIKLKQEKAKNTSYIKCPNCGSDNLLEEKFGTCKYCRRKIENKNYNR